MVILVSGMMAGDPHQGGATWAVLQYVLGLHNLGHEVYVVEPCDWDQGEQGAIESYFREVIARFQLESSAALLRPNTQETCGVSYTKLREFARRADLLINISGMLTDECLLEKIPRRLYLDLDPGFVQFWHMQGIDMRFEAHTHFATIAQCLGRPECTVPQCEREWITTWQPVLLNRWPVSRKSPHEALTTVGNWRGYGSVEFDGVFYGQKAHSVRQIIDLPSRVDVNFLLAMDIHPEEREDLEKLSRYGWRIDDPKDLAGTPDKYQEFLQGSWAELGVCKSGYATSRCGWFSDRSACYLASGRPVIAQETGFSRFLPSGEGVFAFSNVDDVALAVDSLRTDYDHHARAARDIAETYFNSNTVLTRLLQQIHSSS